MIAEFLRQFIEKPAAIKVLVVCMENICRSPMAAGALKQALAQHGLTEVVRVDSAGTHVSLPGSRPDVRAIKVAKSRGIDITKARARRIKEEDFQVYDYVLAVDRSSLEALESIRPALGKSQVQLYMAYATHQKEMDIADPYYGNEAGFNNILNFMECGAEGFAVHLSMLHE